MPELIESYVHGGRIGVLVQLRCVDSFALNTDEFRALSRNLAMHIAASNPRCVDPSDIDPALWERELESLRGSLAGLDAATRQARLREARARFERDHCLMLQPYIKDTQKSVGNLIAEVSGRLKESIEVVRFVRYAVTEP